MIESQLRTAQCACIISYEMYEMLPRKKITMIQWSEMLPCTWLDRSLSSLPSIWIISACNYLQNTFGVHCTQVGQDCSSKLPLKLRPPREFMIISWALPSDYEFTCILHLKTAMKSYWWWIRATTSRPSPPCLFNNHAHLSFGLVPSTIWNRWWVECCLSLQVGDKTSERPFLALVCYDAWQ